MLNIRKETPADYPAVEDMTRRAFYNLYVPGCAEHYLVHIMRSHQDFIPQLDFVLDPEATAKVEDNNAFDILLYGDSVMQYNLYYRLVDEAGTEKEVLTFGPVCVMPEHQRKGYGKLLMEHSFTEAAALGYDVIVIFGSPANYVSRGFQSCKKHNVCVEGGKYPAAMLVKELKPGALDGRRWFYHDSPVMSVDEEAARRYDESLEKLEKKHLPSQEEFYIMSHSFVESDE